MGDAPDWSEFDSHARSVLTNPVRVSESWACPGSPVSQQANYLAAIDSLTRLDDGETHLVGVSNSANGGGDAVYLDVQASRKPVQDAYLDMMRSLKTGNIVCWRSFDEEMLRAAQSYRSDDFRRWVLRLAGSSMTQEEMAFRMAMLPERQRLILTMETVIAILPHIECWVSDQEDSGRRPEVLGEAVPPGILPASMIRFLEQV